MLTLFVVSHMLLLLLHNAAYSSFNVTVLSSSWFVFFAYVSLTIILLLILLFIILCFVFIVCYFVDCFIPCDYTLVLSDASRRPLGESATQRDPTPRSQIE